MHDRSSIGSNWPTTEFAQFKNWQSLERKNVAHFNFEPQSAWINYGKQRLYFPTTCRRLVARLHEKRVALERFWCAGGAPVKSLRCCLILILLGLSSSAALADGIPDPGFGLAGGHTTTVLNFPTDPAFTFSYVGGVTPTTDCGNVNSAFIDLGRTCIDPTHTNLDFINNSGKTWTSLTLEFTKISPSTLAFFATDNANFIDPYFNNSRSGILGNGDPFVTFFGIDSTHPGILPATSCTTHIEAPPTTPCTGPSADNGTLLYDFEVIADVSDSVLTGNWTSTGSATVPEPPTVLLALAGGLLLFLLKRCQ
jgi:hypothetical protein